MFKGMIFTIVLLFPLFASAHPGKTDYRDGHKCWKNCTEWGIGYGEYHLHDKDRKPLRLDRKDRPSMQVQPEPTPQTEPVRETSSVIPPEQVKQETKESEKRYVEQNYITTIYEESILPLNIMFLVLAVLLLMALIFIRKKRKEND